jgi:hypothetical protein
MTLSHLTPEGQRLAEQIAGMPSRTALLRRLQRTLPGWSPVVAWFLQRPPGVLKAVHYLYYLSIGMLAAALVPQIVQVARLQTALSVSLLWVVLSTIDYLCRMVYFLHVKSLPGFAFCIAMVTLLLVLMGLVVQYTYVSTTHITEEDAHVRCGGL